MNTAKCDFTLNSSSSAVEMKSNQIFNFHRVDTDGAQRERKAACGRLD